MSGTSARGSRLPAGVTLPAVAVSGSLSHPGRNDSILAVSRVLHRHILSTAHFTAASSSSTSSTLPIGNQPSSSVYHHSITIGGSGTAATASSLATNEASPSSTALRSNVPTTSIIDDDGTIEAETERRFDIGKPLSPIPFSVLMMNVCDVCVDHFIRASYIVQAPVVARTFPFTVFRQKVFRHIHIRMINEIR
jgi:hypothetical protein